MSLYSPSEEGEEREGELAPLSAGYYAVCIEKTLGVARSNYVPIILMLGGEGYNYGISGR